MKCDELTDRWFWAYPTESVDCDGITGSAHEVYGKSEVDEAIAELKAELESVQATAYADGVDAGMRERRLNRKYWEDKADEAAKMKRLIYDGKITYRDEYCNEMDWRIMHKVWEDEETKCRAKAEEYK